MHNHLHSRSFSFTSSHYHVLRARGCAPEENDSMKPTLSAPLRAIAATTAFLPFPCVLQAEPAPIVVTATRTAQTADQTLAAVTVITREEIQRSQARSLDELLRGIAGVQVSRSGGYGKNTSLFLRGTESDHVLVLIDGVRASAATVGSFAWMNFTPDQIERIEVVRGPRASLYGSDAIGGVIQIFTRKTGGANASVSYGEHNTRQLSAGIGGGSHWQYSLQASLLDTDGIPALTTDTEAFGHRNRQLSMGLNGKPSATTQLALKLNYSNGDNENSVFTGDDEFENRVASARFDQQLTSGWSHHFTLGQSLDRYISHSPYIPSTISTLRNSFAWQHDLVVGEGLLTLGADHWIDRVSKNDSGAIHERIYNSALYLQHQFDALDSQWIIGARQDRQSAFGHENTWNLAWGHDLGSRTHIRAAYGTAYKAPSANDLFWPNNVSYYDDGTGTLITSISQGNPAVQPETSRTAELGIEVQAADTLALTASLYHTRIEDLINWGVTYPAANTEQWMPTNLNDATIQGLELGAQWALADWSLGGSVTFLRAEDDTSGKQLDRRPRRSASLQLGKAIGAGHLDIETLLASERNDRNGSVRLAGYGLTNLTYEQPLHKHWTLQARIENLLDKEYVLAQSFTSAYNTLDRTAYLSVRYQAQ